MFLLDALTVFLLSTIFWFVVCVCSKCPTVCLLLGRRWFRPRFVFDQTCLIKSNKLQFSAKNIFSSKRGSDRVTNYSGAVSVCSKKQELWSGSCLNRQQQSGCIDVFGQNLINFFLHIVAMYLNSENLPCDSFRLGIRPGSTLGVSKRRGSNYRAVGVSSSKLSNWKQKKSRMI